MKKIYKLTDQEENKINDDLGYTPDELEHVSSRKLYVYTLGLPELSQFIKTLKKRKCEECSSKLVFVKECTYDGLRCPVNATGYCNQRRYEVVYKRYCQNCQKIID